LAAISLRFPTRDAAIAAKSTMDVSLLYEASHCLSLNQHQLGELVGVSVRTVQRMYAGRSDLPPWGWTALARAVHPRDPELAARLAKAGGSRLAELGLVAPLQASVLDATHMADSVVCAAAEAIDLSPRTVRPALIAAIRRARQMRLSLEDLEGALGTPERSNRKIGRLEG
jgi:hypothetical protein